MATINFSCSSSDYSYFKENARIRLTYTAKNGTLTITEVEGISSERTWNLNITTIYIKVNGTRRTVNLTNGIDFNTSYTAFGASSTTWNNLPEGQLDVVVEMPSASVSFSEAQFAGKINMTFDKYTIKYDFNGGTGSITSQTKVHGTNIRVSGTVPEREGYEFVNWVSTNPKMTLSPNSVISYNGNLTLIAQWSATAWLIKNRLVTAESLKALHNYNQSAYMPMVNPEALGDLSVDGDGVFTGDVYVNGNSQENGTKLVKSTDIISTANGGTNASDGATGLANLFAAGNTVLSSYQYGDELPAAGNVGRIFFKRLID